MGEPNPAGLGRLGEAPAVGSEQELVPSGATEREVRAQFLSLLRLEGGRLPGRPSLLVWMAGVSHF